MDLIEFLRARLDEDERAARDAGGERWRRHEHHDHIEVDRSPLYPPVAFHVAPYDIHIARQDPARVLAEVDAKRRIVAGCAQAKLAGDQTASALFVVACMLALPYADHPDYQQEWSV